MTATLDDEVADLRYAELQRRLDDALAERDEAQAEKTAMVEVLEVINASPGNLNPVFDAMLEKAMWLCEAAFGGLWTFDGDRYVSTALRGVPTAYAEFLAETTLIPGPGSAPHRFLRGERSVLQNLDLADEEPYRAGDPQRRALVDLGGARTAMQVPLCRDDTVLGVITIYRQEVRPFTDKQIGLLQNFAAQAVVAMENARLLGELRQRTGDLQEALEYQTATSDVLKVISRSTFDLQPVLDTLAETAARLCDAGYSAIFRRDGDAYRISAVVAFSPETMGAARKFQAFLEQHPLVPGRGSITGRVALEGRAVHVADTASDPEYTLSEATTLGNLRTQLGVPLLRDGEPVGVIVVARQRVEPFSERQVELVHTFADQAVIAMENARLLTETREALEQQTATAEVLQVINNSPGDLTPVFEAMLERATTLCESAHGVLFIRDGESDYFRAIPSRNIPRSFTEILTREPIYFDPERSIIAQTLRQRSAVQIADMRLSEPYRAKFPLALAAVESGGTRTLLSVPLFRDDLPVGIFQLARQEVRSFSDKQIALVSNFAAQAVIAIENVRLMTETREALEQQTATAEVLQVINSSPGELQPVFEAILEKAHSLCGASYGSLQLYDGENFRAVAVHGLSGALADHLRQGYSPGPTNPVRRLLEGERFAHVPDLAELDDAFARSVVELGGTRTLLWVALRRNEKVLGLIAAARLEVRSFSDKEIALLEGFAAQAVIAMENARLITETREALEQQTATAEVLQVINSSPGDLTPVFDAMLEKALRLCDAAFGFMDTYAGEVWETVALRQVPPEYAKFLREKRRASPGTAHNRIERGEHLVQIVDVSAEELYRVGDPQRSWLVEAAGARAFLVVSLRKDNNLLGAFSIYRQEVRRFSDTEIALVENFAAQAVIAIENARLITETREALDQQTATAEVLQVINSSPGDLAPVFNAMLEKALRLCGADFGMMNTYNGKHFHHAADRGVPAAYADYRRHRGPMVYGSGTAPTRLVAGENLVHTVDLMATEPYQRGDPARRALVDLGGARTHLSTALRKGDILVGGIDIYRQEVRPFSDKQIALLESFAAQAVIAMENARLLTETQEALEHQTATAEVLQVINSSPGDLTPVFDSILEKAHSFCGTVYGSLHIGDGQTFQAVAVRGMPEAFADLIRRPFEPGPNHPVRQLIGGATSATVINSPEYDDSMIQSAQKLSGMRIALFVPLRKDSGLLGYIVAGHPEVRPFTEKQIALLQNFAAQAVIAMENARLLTETRDALEQQTATAEVLQVINSSPGDLGPVFDAMLAKATGLCQAAFGTLQTYDGERFTPAAAHGVPPAFAAFRSELGAFAPQPGSSLERVVNGENLVHIVDAAADPHQVATPLFELGGCRTLVCVALRKDHRLIGAITAYRQEVRPFSDKQIALLQNFAAQAVIAMENARLLTETREALEQQTATAEVLQVINTSPGDLGPVFDAMLEKAIRLCEAVFGVLVTVNGNCIETVAQRNVPEQLLAFLTRQPVRVDPASNVGRTILERRVVHILG
jgi:GAF domain-containing protein